jgi:hypothetical protein
LARVWYRIDNHLHQDHFFFLTLIQPH